MFKIWARTYLGDKLIHNLLFYKDEQFKVSRLNDYIIEICNTLDIPSPIVLTYHKNNFDKFNLCKFTSGDFVESIDFDRLNLEYVKDK